VSASEGVARSLDRLHGLASGAARTVRGSVEDIEELMTGSLSAIEQAETHLKAISRQIGEVVAGIQIHDSMSQRVTHINKALEDAAALCTLEECEVIQHDDVAERRFTAAHSIIELQIAQLGRIIGDIETAHVTTQQAFDDIGTEVQGLARSLLELKVGAPADSGDPSVAHDPFEAIRADLFGLHDLLTEASELVDRIQETGDAAVATTRRLEGHMVQVDGIGFEIRMIALNAIIKAAHLGETGSALEMVAQEVNTLSNETNGFVDRVKGVLAGVVDQVRKLDRETLTDGDAEQEGEEALAAGISQVTGTYDQFREATAQMVVRAGDLKDEIGRILSALAFLPSLSGDLSALMERLTAIAEMLRPRVREHLRASVDEVNRLTERYTMRLERGVHRQLLGEGSDPRLPEPEAAPEKKRSPDQEELGDNVELF
jgi:archaellum component FlaC